MTRQFDKYFEERQRKANIKLVAAIEFDLAKAVARSGGVLNGYSVRCQGKDSLLTLRATLAGRDQVAFVGAGSTADAFRKAVREGYSDKLAWKADKYST